jgi:hypothetical protein
VQWKHWDNRSSGAVVSMTVEVEKRQDEERIDGF